MEEHRLESRPIIATFFDVVSGSARTPFPLLRRAEVTDARSETAKVVNSMV